MSWEPLVPALGFSLPIYGMDSLFALFAFCPKFANWTLGLPPEQLVNGTLAAGGAPSPAQMPMFQLLPVRVLQTYPTWPAPRPELSTESLTWSEWT